MGAGPSHLEEEEEEEEGAPPCPAMRPPIHAMMLADPIGLIGLIAVPPPPREGEARTDNQRGRGTGRSPPGVYT